MRQTLFLILGLFGLMPLAAQERTSPASHWGIQIRLGTEAKIDVNSYLNADLRFGLRYKEQTAFGLKLFYDHNYEPGSISSMPGMPKFGMTGNRIDNLYGVYVERAFKPNWKIQPTLGLDALWGTTRFWDNRAVRSGSPIETKGQVRSQFYNGWLGLRWWPYSFLAVNTDLLIYHRRIGSIEPETFWGVRWGIEVKLPLKGGKR